MKHFIPPWDDVARYQAADIEQHTAMCRALQLHDSTNPATLRTKLISLEDEEKQSVWAVGLKARELADELFGWFPPGYNPDDLTDPYAELKNTTSFFVHFAYWGGRGGGKSHGVAEAIVNLASTRVERVVCGREFQNSIKDSVKELLEEKIASSGYAADWKSTESELVNTKTGSRITFIGMNRNPQSAKSLEGCTLFWGEEAQAFSQDSLDVIIPTVMRMATSRCVWSWNPDESDTPIDVMFKEGEPPERAYIRPVLVEDNPYFYTGQMPGQMRMAWHKVKKSKFRHIWRGAYDENPEGLVFTDWSIGRINTGGLEPLYGLDWGWVDPFACIEIYVLEPNDPKTERGKIFISRECYGAYIPAKKLPSRVREAMPMIDEGHITADSAEPKSIDDFQDAGFSIAGARKGPGSVRAGISFIQSYDIVVDPDCTNVIKELGKYKWKTDRTGKVLRDPEDKDNHACDAIRYGLEDYQPPVSVVYV